MLEHVGAAGKGEEPPRWANGVSLGRHGGVNVEATMQRKKAPIRGRVWSRDARRLSCGGVLEMGYPEVGGEAAMEAAGLVGHGEETGGATLR